MCTVYDEAARAHRSKPGKALRHPVCVGDRFNAEPVRRRRTGYEPDQFTQSRLVGRGAEMDGHMPSSVVAFEGRTGCVLGIEAFAEVGRNPAGGRFVAGKMGDSCGRM